MITATLPRIAYNAGLAKEWLERHPVRPGVASVADQLPTITVNRRALSPFGYNPSIIRYDNRLLLAYRWHEPKTWMTSIWMAELDPQFNVTDHRRVDLPGPSSEDPRLFIHQGELWIAYVQARGWTSRSLPTCVMRYGRLVAGKSSWSVEGQHLVKYGRNDDTTMEKNWVPFSYAERVHFIYQCSPEQIVIDVDGNNVVSESRTPARRWRYGGIKGGSPPLDHNGNWLRFFHSRLDNEGGTYNHRYYIGALVMASTPPFGQIAASQKPILRGSTEDMLPVEERGKCPHWKGNVVFPAGGVQVDGGWLVSVGVNDCACALVKVDEAHLYI